MKLNKKNWKITLLGLCAATCVVTAGAVATRNENVTAAGSPDNPIGVSFVMDGASIRIDTPTGLRFEAIMSTADYASLTAYEAQQDVDVEFGMALMPTSYKETAELTAESMFGWTSEKQVDESLIKYCWGGAQENKTQILHASTSDLSETTNLATGEAQYSLRCVITKMDESNYLKDFYAKPYMVIKKDGVVQNYYFCADNGKESRNVTYVAQRALATEQAKDTPNTNALSVFNGIIETGATNGGANYSYTVTQHFTDKAGATTEKEVTVTGKTIGEAATLPAMNERGYIVDNTQSNVTTGVVMCDNSTELEVWYVYDEDAYWDGYTKISTGAELKNVIETNTSGAAKYYLADDIDMTDITVDSTKWFRGTLEGNGHKIDNISYTGRWLYGLDGTIKDTAFYATATIANGTNYYTIVNFISTMNNSTYENVYIDLTIDANNATYAKADGTASGFINEVTANPIAQETNSGQSGARTYKDVLVNVSFKNASNVRTMKLSALQQMNVGSISMNNVYMIAQKAFNSNTYSLLNSFAGSSKITAENPASYTIQNGDDVVITETYTTTGTAKPVNAGSNYVFSTMNAFAKSAYAAEFTHEMWDDVIVYDETAAREEELLAAGYKPITDGAGLKTALEGGYLKYYLANDIDMTGITMSGDSGTQKRFSGTLDGNGHAITGAKTCKYFLQQFDGTMKNLTMDLTLEYTGVATELGLFYRTCYDYNATMENVYLKVTIDGNDANASLLPSVVLESVHSTSKTLTMNNVIVEFDYVECDNVNFGKETSIVRDLRGGTVNMTNVYTVSISSKPCYLIRQTTSTYEKVYNVTNGNDAALTGSFTTSGQACTGTAYWYADMATFVAAKTADETTTYSSYFEGAMWDKVFGR